MTSQVISCLLQTLKCHCLVHKMPPLNLSWISCIQSVTCTDYLFVLRYIFNVAFLYMPRSVVSGVSLTAVCMSFISQSHAMCPPVVFSLVQSRQRCWQREDLQVTMLLTVYFILLLLSITEVQIFFDYDFRLLTICVFILGWRTQFLYTYETLGMSWELGVHKFWATAFCMVAPNIFSSFCPITYRSIYFFMCTKHKVYGNTEVHMSL